jgi:hypothetical protein
MTTEYQGVFSQSNTEVILSTPGNSVKNSVKLCGKKLKHE